MISKNILKKVTYTKVVFNDERGEWTYYFKGVTSPAQVRRIFTSADNIECYVKTEVRAIDIKKFIENSQLLDSETLKYY